MVPHVGTGAVTADDLRSIDVRFLHDEPAFVLHRDELEEVELAVASYLGL